MTDVEADGVGSDFGITESVRFWVRCDVEFKMVDHGFRKSWVTSEVKVDYAIQFQDYSEARLISKVMVKFQATGRH
ncbi:Pdz Domain-Containing Protein 8 [Manis pentadactyla]|nr:Pdz Domain-Containing Protein 8 [Manis pentadactyla]